jgi:TonB family protein
MRLLVSVSCFAASVFLLCGPALCAQETPATASPKDPKELMLAAARLNNLTTSDTEPWHIKARWQILNEHGAATNEGTYEEFWGSSQSSKRVFTGKDFAQTEYTTAKGDFRTSSSHGNVPPVLISAHNDLISAIPDERTIEHTTYSAKPFANGNLKLTCISPALPGRVPAFCLGMDEPLLRVYSIPAYSSPTNVLYNQTLRFKNKVVAGDLKLASDGKIMFSLQIETLEPLDTNNEASFTPPSDAELAPIVRRVYISAGGAQGMIVHKVQPEYPVEARTERVVGTVSLQAVIGTDGKIKELKVTSGPAALQKAASEAVWQWRYRPYLLNGSPVEVVTMINVVFLIG